MTKTSCSKSCAVKNMVEALEGFRMALASAVKSTEELKSFFDEDEDFDDLDDDLDDDDDDDVDFPEDDEFDDLIEEDDIDDYSMPEDEDEFDDDEF